MADLEQVSVLLPSPLVERLRAEAAKTNDSISHVVRKMLMMVDTFRSLDGKVEIHDVVVPMPAESAA